MIQLVSGLWLWWRYSWWKTLIINSNLLYILYQESKKKVTKRRNNQTDWNLSVKLWDNILKHGGTRLNVVLHKRDHPCMKKEKSKKLCASSYWLGNACEDIIVFQLQNLTIEEQIRIVRFFVAPDFDQKRRSSSVVAFRNGKVMMLSHAVIWVNWTEHTTDWFSAPPPLLRECPRHVYNHTRHSNRVFQCLNTLYQSGIFKF